MKLRSTQFSVHENTASSTQHASRDKLSLLSALSSQESPTISPNNAERTAVAAGEEGRENHLLTVHEVAALLQVPVSWVYGRTRKRSAGRLPGYRLGKYWRFREAEILAWLKSQGYARGCESP